MAKAELPLAFHYGVEIRRLLSLDYGELLSTDMRIYLSLYRALVDKERETAEVFLHINDVIRNAMHQMAEAGRASINIDAASMARHLFLAAWHLKHARVLTLIPSVNLLEYGVDLVIKFLIHTERSIDGPVTDKAKSLLTSHVSIVENASRTIFGTEPASVPQIPSEREVHDIEKIIDELQEILIDYQEFMNYIVGLYDGMPAFSDIKRELAIP